MGLFYYQLPDAPESLGSTAYAYGSMGLQQHHHYHGRRNWNISGTKPAISLIFFAGGTIWVLVYNSATTTKNKIGTKNKCV
jgi:hypothetical protein